MKIEIVGQSAPAEPEPVLRLRLEDDSGGDVDLVSVDENGRFKQYLLGIQSNGCVIRYSGIDSDTGLNLDENGRIIVEDS